MIEQDTIKLLRECDAGIKMGISSIDDVLQYASDPKLRDCLSDGKADHQKLQSKVEHALQDFHDEGKEPNMMAKSMSWLKTNMKLTMNESDATIADLITDGCDMGVKSLSKYLNQYQAASEESKDIAKNLIKTEEHLGMSMRAYL